VGVFDVHALAGRTAVAGLVRGENHRAVGDQLLGDPLVAPGVLAVAVRQQRNPIRLRSGPLADHQVTAQARNLTISRLDHVGHSSTYPTPGLVLPREL